MVGFVFVFGGDGGGFVVGVIWFGGVVCGVCEFLYVVFFVLWLGFVCVFFVVL